MINHLEELKQIPDEYSISDPFPNPFNPSVTINFSIPEENKINIYIYDITGRIIEKVYNNRLLNAGYHSINWNASFHASGIYFIVIDTGELISTKKVTLLK